MTQVTDIGFGAITRTYARNQIIDFLYPHMINTYSFTSPLPQIKPFVNLFEPFDTYTWISLLSTLFIVLFCKFLSKQLTLIKWPDMGTLLTRYIWGINLLLNVIIRPCYSGCIYSLITLPHEYRIETLDELIWAQNCRQVQILIRPGIIWRHFFKV